MYFVAWNFTPHCWTCLFITAFNSITHSSRDRNLDIWHSKPPFAAGSSTFLLGAHRMWRLGTNSPPSCWGQGLHKDACSAHCSSLYWPRTMYHHFCGWWCDWWASSFVTKRSTVGRWFVVQWCKENDLFLNLVSQEIVVDINNEHWQYSPLTIDGPAVERLRAPSSWELL